MDPNNQNPQVDTNDISKLESDLKNLQNNLDPQQPVPDPVTTQNPINNEQTQTSSTISAVSPPPLPRPPMPPVANENVQNGVSSGQPQKKSNIVLTVSVVLIVLSLLSVVVYLIVNKLVSPKQPTVVTPVVVATPTATPTSDGIQNDQPNVASDSSSPTSQPTEITDKRFDIKSSAFTPISLTVGVGEVIMVNNNDTVGHSLTADDGSFDTGVLQAGETKTFVAPTKAGEYTFHCTLHPTMQGVLVVK